jgi:hypothetical protein
MVGALLRWKYPLRRRLKQVRTLKQLAGTARDELRYFLRRRANTRPIVKDPIALFSAEWLATTFQMDVLVTIRHPAAFCSSIKLMNWRTDFSHFLKQPYLMRKFFGTYETQMRTQVSQNGDIIGNAILLWNCTHHVIREYRDAHSNWLFVRHEDLSIDPVSSFEAIYKDLNLEFTSNARRAILESSGTHNPAEQDLTSPLMRNSKENVNNWRRRLTENEVDQIRMGTSEVWPSFYSDAEW